MRRASIALRRVAALLWGGLLVLPRPLSAQELPPQLRGRVHIEVLTCTPHAASPRLRTARIRIVTGETEVSLPDLQCGAFAPGSDRALFLNPVTGASRVPPHTTLELRAVFPADRVHSECRCVVGGVRRIGRDAGKGLRPWRDTSNTSDTTGEPPSGAKPIAQPAPEGLPRYPEALRRELVLLPTAAVRRAPRQEASRVGQLAGGTQVDVLSVEGGWKQIRGPGIEGWIPDDAATSDLLAPARLSRVLARARAQLARAPDGRSGESGLCSTVSAKQLHALIFALLPEERTAYVSALWYALPEIDHDTFQVWAADCHGITRIVDLARGLEIRSQAWGDTPHLPVGSSKSTASRPRTEPIYSGTSWLYRTAVGWRDLGRGKLALALLCALGWPGSALAGTRISAVLDSEWAFGLGDAQSQKLEAVLQPHLETDLPRGWHLDARARLRADGFDRIEPGELRQESTSRLSKRVRMGRHAELELRELFAAGPVGPAWVTLGKQQIVWGEADGLKVLDIVDPQSFREFILDDFEDSRIPLWALNVELPVGPTELQLIWQPDPTFDDNPRPDALFSPSAPRFLPPLLPGTLPVFRDPQRPQNLLKDGDAGTRWSGQLAGWDWSVNYLYHFDDQPIFFARQVAGPIPTVVYTPKYRRTHTVGGTFSNSFGDLTVRGELGWQSDRFLSTRDARVSDLVVDAPQLRYVIGLDWFGFENTFLSFQVFQSWLLERPPDLLQDPRETAITLLVRRDLWNQQLRLEMIWLHSLKDNDGLLRPKVSYEVRDGVTLYLGFDVFYGTSRGVFGQFDNRDRMVLGMEWGF